MDSSPSSGRAQTFDLHLAAGAGDRQDVIATVQLPPEAAGFVRSLGDDGAVVHLVDANGEVVPAQLDETARLTWLAAGTMDAGATRRYRCTLEGAREGRTAVPPRVEVRLQADRVWFISGGRLLTRYVYQGTWKPYFWPIMTPSGNVVRGASGEHQHQTGLFFAYGGHGGPTTSNVWSDWDEPTYGPDGKALHTSWELVEGGAVYGRLVQRLTYTNASAGHLLDERREVRVYPLPDGAVLLDVCEWPSPPEEEGPSPFILAARVAESLRLVNLNRRGPDGKPLPLERPGQLAAEDELRLENAANATFRTAGGWLDWSGEVTGGTAGLAFFDHPDNPQDGRGLVAGGYGCMTMRSVYPPTARPGSVAIRRRVLAHADDAGAGRVASRFRDYVDPAPVTVE